MADTKISAMVDAGALGGTEIIPLVTGGLNKSTTPGGGLLTYAQNNISLNANKITAGTLAVDRGGTNIGSYAVGDLLYASGATTLAKLADVATGNVLLSGGVATAPAWGKVDVTAAITGIVPSENGGTGVNNAGTLTNATNTTITGGGTLALGGFTLTVPATGSAALLATANVFTTAQTISVSNAAALAVGPNGNTNPALRVVSNVASAATGISITGNAAGSGATLTVLSSGTNENFNLVSKGSGRVNVSADGGLTLIISGTNRAGIGTGYFMVALTYGFLWSSDPINTIGDTGFFRSAAGVVEVTNGTAGQWGALKAGTRDSATNTTSVGLTLGHQSTGTPAASFGSAILFNLNSDTTADQNASQIETIWTTATHASRTSNIVFYTVNNAAALAESFRIRPGMGVFPSGSAAAPGLGPAIGTTSGFYATANNRLQLSFNGSARFEWNTSAFVIGSAAGFGWASGSNPEGSTAGDTALMRSAVGVVEINNGTAGQWGALKAGTRDAGTNTTSVGLTLGHQSTGTPAASFGIGFKMALNSDTTADQDASQIETIWTTATHATRTSNLLFKTITNAGSLLEVLRLIGTDTAIFGWRMTNAASGGTPNLTVTTPTQAASAIAGTPLSITASAAVAGSSNAGAAAGGDVTITAGAAARLTSGNANGGNINLTPGAGIGTGTAGQVIIPIGATGFPTITFVGQTTTGMTYNGGLSLVQGGTDVVNIASNRFQLNSATPLAWGSAGPTGAIDTAVRRSAAGVVEINSANTPGQWGSLKCGTRDAGTTTITDGLTLGHQSTGTAAAGFGSAIQINLDSSTTADQNAVRLTSEWVVATHASRTARYKINVYDTASREVLRGEASGTAAMIGFLGANAAVRQASGADLTNNVTSGGTDDTIANFTDLTVYANDSAAIRNDIYQLARKLKQVNDALRLYGLLT